MSVIDELLELRAERERINKKIADLEDAVLDELLDHYRSTDSKTVKRNIGRVTLRENKPRLVIQDSERFTIQLLESFPHLVDTNPRPVSGAHKQLPIKTVRRDGHIVLNNNRWAKGIVQEEPAEPYGFSVSLVGIE